MESSDSDMELSEESQMKMSLQITFYSVAPHSPASEDISRLTSPIVRPKTSAEEDRITCALATSPAGEDIEIINITLTRQDFWTLKGMEWLNDQVIFCLIVVTYIRILMAT